MPISKREVAVYPASERVRFVVYAIDPLPDEYHIYKEVRDAFGGEQWFGAIYQCEKAEDVAKMVAQSCAATYAERAREGAG